MYWNENVENGKGLGGRWEKGVFGICFSFTRLEERWLEKKKKEEEGEYNT